MSNKKIVLKTNIKRDRNFLYCCGTTEEGNLTIIQVERSARSLGKKNGKK